jgi:hypothetical protein
MATAPAQTDDPNAPIYEAIRKADAAGDADSVARLSLYLKQQQAPIAEGHTMGFADEAPVEAQASQLSPEDEQKLIALARQPGTTADDLRKFAADRNRVITNADDVIKARDAGAGVNNAINYPLPKIDLADGSEGAAERGFASGLSLGAYPRIQAAFNAGGDFFAGKGYDYGQQLDNVRGVLATDAEQHPWMHFGGEMAGGAMLPIGAAAEAKAGLEGAEALNAATKAGAKVGGATSAIYGFNSANADLSRPSGWLNAGANALIQGGIGAAAGAGAGFLGGKITNALASRAAVETVPSDAQNVIQAANRQGVNVLAADVGGPFTRNMTAGLAQTPLGSGPIINRAKSAIDTFKGAVGRIAGTAGEATDEVGAGQAAQAGARQFLSAQDKKIENLYNAIPIGATRPAVAVNTRAALTDLTQGLESNPELSKIWAENPRLKATLDALTPKTQPIMSGSPGATVVKQVGTQFDGGGVSWQDLKRVRSIIGQIIGRPGLESDGSQIEALRKVYGAISEDMRATAAGEGPKALNAFNRANGFYAANANRVSDTVSQILGSDMKQSPEAAFAQIQRWAKNGGNAAQVGRALRTMGPDQANTVRATIISKLGAASAGKQNAEGTAFSVDAFLTQWNNIAPRAKAVLFTPEQRAALNDLATVANGMKEAGRFANHSNTGGAMAVGKLIETSVGASSLLSAGSGHILPAVGGLLALVGEYGGAKFLASPTAVRWATGAARAKSPQALASAANRLTSIATKDPGIATEALGIKDAILRAVNDNLPKGGRAAASPNEGPSNQQQPER